GQRHAERRTVIRVSEICSTSATVRSWQPAIVKTDRQDPKRPSEKPLPSGSGGVTTRCALQGGQVPPRVHPRMPTLTPRIGRLPLDKQQRPHPRPPRLQNTNEGVVGGDDQAGDGERGRLDGQLHAEAGEPRGEGRDPRGREGADPGNRSEEHTSELQ